MKKLEMIKILAIILIPGGIPVWIGYKIYERAKKGKTNNRLIRNLIESSSDDS